jgi:ankyrin repeat protein
MRPYSRVGVLTLVLAIGCNACFLVPPPRSAYMPIHRYARDGDAASVEADLTANPQDLNLPDDARLTPLHLAAAHCHANVVEILLNKGAAANRKGAGGAIALHLAAQEGCIDVVVILVARGSKVNARDDARRTPLKRSEEWHQDVVAAFLRENGGTE